MSGLRAALSVADATEDRPGQDDAPVDREQAATALRKLSELLAADDSEAVDHLDETGHLLRGLLGPSSFREIEKL